MILVRDRKHPTKKIGNTFNVPLLGNAYAIIKRQRKTIGPEGQEPRIFPFVADSVGSAFARAVTAAKVPNFHFHDLRHEAVSSLFEAGYAIPEVALVSGHRSWGSLKRYANLKPEGLHSGPVAHQGAKLRKAAA
jgi:integrase